MAHGDAREEKWRGNKGTKWVTSKRHMTAEHRLARAVQTLQTDVNSSPANSRLNWRPCRFKWTRPFRRKTKSGFCACTITFQTQSTSHEDLRTCILLTTVRNISYLENSTQGSSCCIAKAKLNTFIQGVTGGTDQTSGECSLGQTIPI